MIVKQVNNGMSHSLRGDQVGHVRIGDAEVPSVGVAANATNPGVSDRHDMGEIAHIGAGGMMIQFLYLVGANQSGGIFSQQGAEGGIIA